jgi:hypothetical protein
MLNHIAKIAPRTVIFDVEPLVAFWDTDSAALERGIAQLLERLRDLTGIEVVVFATNSARRQPESRTTNRSRKSSTSPPPASRFEPSHTAACPVPASLSEIKSPRTVSSRDASATASCTTSRTCQDHRVAHARCACWDVPCDRSCSPPRSRRQ